MLISPVIESIKPGYLYNYTDVEQFDQDEWTLFVPVAKSANCNSPCGRRVSMGTLCCRTVETKGLDMMHVYGGVLITKGVPWMKNMPLWVSYGSNVNHTKGKYSVWKNSLITGEWVFHTQKPRYKISHPTSLQHSSTVTLSSNEAEIQKILTTHQQCFMSS